jgi:hypothetical protein
MIKELLDTRIRPTVQVGAKQQQGVIVKKICLSPFFYIDVTPHWKDSIKYRYITIHYDSLFFSVKGAGV